MVSSYFSIFFAIGMMVGYFGTNIYCKKFVLNGRIEPVIFNLTKNWEFHLHHWILGLLIALFVYLAGLFSSLPVFITGALGGLIIHDFYTDKKWYRVVYRKK